MARGARRDVWGWNLPARWLLAFLVLLSAAGIGQSSWRGRRGVAPDPRLVIDPNTCPAAVLPALPRIGPVLASRILAERSQRPFSSLEDLDLRVRGIGPATAAAIRPHLKFESRPESAASPTSSDRPTEP